MVEPKKIKFGQRFMMAREDKATFDGIILTYTGEGRKILMEPSTGGRAGEQLFVEFLLERKGKFEWLRIYEEQNKGIYGATLWEGYRFSMVGKHDDGRAVALIVVKVGEIVRQFRFGQEFSIGLMETGKCENITIVFSEIGYAIDEKCKTPFVILKADAGDGLNEVNVYTRPSPKKWKGYTFYLISVIEDDKKLARLRIEKAK